MGAERAEWPPPLRGGHYRTVPHHPFFFKILFGNKKINFKFVKPFSIKLFFIHFFLMKNKIFLIVAGILGYVGYQKYLLSQSVTINFKSLSFNGGNFIKPIINIVLTITNPTKISADIQNISGKIFLDNLEIGKIENLRYVSKILSNQSIDMDFNLEIDNLGIGVALLTSNLKNKIVKFNGSVKVDFFNIPVNFEHKIL